MKGIKYTRFHHIPAMLESFMWAKWVKEHPLTMHITSGEDTGVTIYFSFEEDGERVLLLDEDDLPCCFNHKERAEVFAKGGCTYRQHWIPSEKGLVPTSNNKHKAWLRKHNLEFSKHEHAKSIKVKL